MPIALEGLLSPMGRHGKVVGLRFVRDFMRTLAGRQRNPENVYKQRRSFTGICFLTYFHEDLLTQSRLCIVTFPFSALSSILVDWRYTPRSQDLPSVSILEFGQYLPIHLLGDSCENSTF